MRYLNTIIWLFFLGCLPNLVTATPNTQHSADKTIQKLYHRLDTKPTPMATRLDQISRYFLNQPYENNGLGEGPDANYDQFPLYRADTFDCETYVDTVLAIALSCNFKTFTQCINQVRYKNGEIAFTTRNHFTSLDWNPNNQKAGLTKDITQKLIDKNNQPVAKISTTLINKPKWYAVLSKDRIRLPGASQKEQAQQFEALKKAGQALKAKTVQLPYIPLTALFNKKGEPNQALFNQIPNGAIIEIVRPNWNLKEKIGTNLDVSHMGFAFRKNAELRFRHASLSAQKIVDISLISYLEKARTSPTIRGINIQVVVPNTPTPDMCN
jgi:hypothetical protein